jgi:transcriptional regulator with XRE-family HTH domain
LDTLIQEQGLDRSRLLSTEELAVRTALTEPTVRALLEGAAPPDDTVNERFSSRIRVLAGIDLRSTGRKMAALAAEVAENLNVSDVWARLILEGKKVPNIEHLHNLAEFFDLEAGEAFFTASADKALNRVLLPLVAQLESRELDPVDALLRKYGVQSTDLRQHGSMTPEALERLLEGVIQSVMPRKEDGQ